MSAINDIGLIEFKQQAKELTFTGSPHAARLDDIEEKIGYLALWLSKLEDEMLRKDKGDED